MEEELDLLDVFYCFMKRKLWLILALIVGAILGVIYTRFIIIPEYTSSVTLILSKPTTVTSETAVDSSGAITQSDVLLNQKLISTYGEIMKSRKVSNTVIKNLNLDMEYEEIIKCVDVSAVKDTDVIKLSITTKEPVMSSEIAAEMTKVFTEEIVKIYNIQNVSIIDEANVDYEPVNVSYKKNAVIFGIIAFVLVSGVIFLVYYFDNNIKTTEDIEKVTDLYVLATIPMIENDEKKSEKEAKKNVKK